MSRQIRDALAHDGHYCRRLLRQRFGVEDVRLTEGFLGHVVADSGVTLHARTSRAMFLVYEPRDARVDIVMTCDAALVGDGRVSGDREGRLSCDVSPDLLNRIHLVHEAGDLAVVNMTLDARNTSVWADGPRVVVRLHLMARRAEGGLIGRACYGDESQHAEEERDDDD